jgi:hypothetical protein
MDTSKGRCRCGGKLQLDASYLADALRQGLSGPIPLFLKCIECARCQRTDETYQVDEIRDSLIRQLTVS